jgi:hypothetical protein
VSQCTTGASEAALNKWLFIWRDMKKIPLTQGKFAVVDEDDYERISKNRWHYTSKGYARRNNNATKQAIMMHREVMKIRRGRMQVDHINGDKLDNRKANLRLCTNQQNSFNRKNETGKLKYRGVYMFKNRNKKFCARIRIDGRTLSKGMYHTIEEAARQYNVMAKKYHGEFARLNLFGGGQDV